MSHAIQLRSDGSKAGKLQSRGRQAGSRHSCRQRDPLWEWTEGTCLTTVPRHMTKLLKSRLGCHSSSLLEPLLQPVTSARGRPSLKWSKSLQNPLRPRRPRQHAAIQSRFSTPHPRNAAPAVARLLSLPIFFNFRACFLCLPLTPQHTIGRAVL